MTEVKSVESEIGFYTPLATHVFGALLGYPPKQRVINKSGKHGIPDVRLYSQEDGSEWVVVEAKLDDAEIRADARRARIWHEQVLEHGYIGPETYYVMLCAPYTFYVCDLDGQIVEALHIEDDALLDPKSGRQFPLSGVVFRERLHLVSYAASLERRQFEAFREGKLKSGHIRLTPETLPQLHSVFEQAIEKLKEYCSFRFGQLRAEYEEAQKAVADLQQRFDDAGSGAVKARARLRYRMLTLRARHELAFQIFERDYDRFRHDQTYAGTEKEENFEDIFCTNTAYVALSRLFFVRICEDTGLTTRKISNSGIAVWRSFVENIKEHYQDLLEVAFKDVRHIYLGLFEPTVFDWFGKSDGKLHDILERILFRLNAFNFREINRDVLGSIYQYFRPRIERRRLGEYYTPVEVVDFILSECGYASDPDIMQKRILDPSCGSFTFGVRAVQPLLRAGAHLSAQNKIDLIRNSVRGQDINPFSAFLSHLSLVFTILDVYLAAKSTNPEYEIAPFDVGVRNSLTFGVPDSSEADLAADSKDLAPEEIERFHYIVGNPPFVRNERLPEPDRAVLRSLFPSLAIRNTDLSVFFLYVAVKYLATEDARIGMVAPVGVANTQMAAYLRNVLKEYEITELVSLEWCAKEVFPGADIVPMLIFIRKKAPAIDHRLKLVRGLSSLAEVRRCLNDPPFLASKSSYLPFSDWTTLSPFGDWCLEVAAADLPILEKLRSRPTFEAEDVARCGFAVKAGNNAKFLRPIDRKAENNEAPFVKGQHIGAFRVSDEVDEYADLGKIQSAEDASIWGELDFYQANRGLTDDTGLGRQDYKTPHKLATGSPSDVLCCLIPEIYVTLAAAVADPLSVVANNSVIVVVPKKFSAYCLAAIINSRVSRYYAFLTLRSAILLRRRTTWFPRAIKALRMPALTPQTSRKLHDLAFEATQLSATVRKSAVEAYADEISTVADLTKAGFLGVQAPHDAIPLYREDLAAAQVDGSTLPGYELSNASADVMTLLPVALLASEQEEFDREAIENLPLPADPGARARLAAVIRDFESGLKKTQDRVLAIMEEIDEVVAVGLGLSPGEHEVIRRRCQEFPLSVTVERPRFAWSADRKRQARRTYRPGERFK
ncbi:MAG TPA: N-6 DNA methylase [Terriglobia bacterium]|nr:N-6 DNA methylase [Terriglobia bacterium]